MSPLQPSVCQGLLSPGYPRVQTCSAPRLDWVAAVYYLFPFQFEISQCVELLLINVSWELRWQWCCYWETSSTPPTWETVASLSGGGARHTEQWHIASGANLATVGSSPPPGETGRWGRGRRGELTGTSRGVWVWWIFQDKFWTLWRGRGRTGGGNVTRLVVVLSKCVI